MIGPNMHPFRPRAGTRGALERWAVSRSERLWVFDQTPRFTLCILTDGAHTIRRGGKGLDAAAKMALWAWERAESGRMMFDGETLKEER
jgi:hypothetical protein